MFVIQQQPETLLMSLAGVTMEGHTDVLGQATTSGHSDICRLCWGRVVVNGLGSYLKLWATIRSMVLLQPEYVMVSVSC